jgi:hypothetical protein
MIVAFTICSNNYLGAAKVLVESVKKYHPEFELYIGLVDELNVDIDYATIGCTIIPAKDIRMPDLEELSQRFNIVELNTTVKPFYFKHFFFTLEASSVIYLDPDIELFSRLAEVEVGMRQAMITLTPHMLSPIDDDLSPTDKHILPTGIFNLGFIALSRHKSLASFLDWWADRCVKYGYRLNTEGLFYDQIWMNYVPAFYESYYIIRDPGYNVANWNLHERHISKDETDSWVVNNHFLLAFFHYSHYNLNKPRIISSYNSRYNLDNRPDVAPLFEMYQAQLIANNGQALRALTPYYKIINDKVKEKANMDYYTFKRKLTNKVVGLINRIIPD